MPVQAISMLPEYVHVGLITFGTHVHVYEIGFTELSKCFVFRGSKEYTTQQVRHVPKQNTWAADIGASTHCGLTSAHAPSQGLSMHGAGMSTLPCLCRL